MREPDTVPVRMHLTPGGVAPSTLSDPAVRIAEGVYELYPWRSHRIRAHVRGRDSYVTLNGRWVYTYRDTPPGDAIGLVCDTAAAVQSTITPDSHEDHWYIRGREDYARQYLKWFPRHIRKEPPTPPEGLPQRGDVVHYDDGGETPEHEGPAVVLTVYRWDRNVWAWDLHTRAGVLTAVRNSECLRVVRPRRMSNDTAREIRDTVWTTRMRKQYRSLPDATHLCACQAGPSGHCFAGRHHQCQFTRTETRRGLVVSESWLTARDGSALEPVWLADRTCRWVCPCDCRHVPKAADDGAPAGQLALFA